jgi:hypothetical protein
MARTKKAQDSAAKQVKTKEVKSLRTRAFDIMNEFVKEILKGNITHVDYTIDEERIVVGNSDGSEGVKIRVNDDNIITFQLQYSDIPVYKAVSMQREVRALEKEHKETTDRLKEAKEMLESLTEKHIK